MNVSIAKVRNNLADALNRAAYAGERVILLSKLPAAGELVTSTPRGEWYARPSAARWPNKQAAEA